MKNSKKDTYDDIFLLCSHKICPSFLMHCWWLGSLDRSMSNRVKKINRRKTFPLSTLVFKLAKVHHHLWKGCQVSQLEKIQRRDCDFLQSVACIGSSSSDYIVVVIESSRWNIIEKVFPVQETMRAKYKKEPFFIVIKMILTTYFISM